MDNWTDALSTLPNLPAMDGAQGVAPPQRNGYHVSRAGFGTWAAIYFRDPAADVRFGRFRDWKVNAAGHKEIDFLDEAAAALEAMIRAWSPIVPSDWIITAPPQGATKRNSYPAAILASEVANRLDIDFCTTLKRSDSKKYHHPLESMRQEPYRITVVPPAVVIVIDDFISSGTTLLRCREAFAAVGVPSFCFAWGTV